MNSSLSQFSDENRILQSIVTDVFQTAPFSRGVTVLFDDKGKVTNVTAEYIEATPLKDRQYRLIAGVLEDLWLARLMFGQSAASSVRIFSSLSGVCAMWEPQSFADSIAPFSRLNLIIQPLSFERENDPEALASGQNEVGYIHANTASWPTKSVQIMVQHTSSVMHRLSDAIQCMIRHQTLIAISASEWIVSDDLYFCTGAEITPLTLTLEDYSCLLQKQP